MHITLRHVEPGDMQAVAAILSDLTVMLGTMRLPFMPAALVQERTAAAPGIYRLVAEVDGKVVGFCQMRTFPDVPRHNHVGEIDLMAVSGEFQGRGVGKAMMNALLDLADNWLHLERTGLLVWSDNARAIALYQAFGFEVEGTMRRYAKRPGGFADAHSMGRIVAGDPRAVRSGTAEFETA